MNTDGFIRTPLPSLDITTSHQSHDYSRQHANQSTRLHTEADPAWWKESATVRIAFGSSSNGIRFHTPISFCHLQIECLEPIPFQKEFECFFQSEIQNRHNGGSAHYLRALFDMRF